MVNHGTNIDVWATLAIQNEILSTREINRVRNFLSIKWRNLEVGGKEIKTFQK